MITKVNDMDLRVLTLFTKKYDVEYHIREVEKRLGVSSRTALLTLAKLEKKGILESKIKGKNKSYTIKNSFLSREHFLLTEQYKKISFLEKNPLIREVVERIERATKDVVIVFGSYAKNTQKEDSDLDVFVTGNYDDVLINEIGKTYGVHIQVKNYPLSVFKKNMHEDILLREIIENHIIIKGAELFVKSVKKWTR